MARLLVRPMLLLAALWALPILMIRAQPYDNSRLRELMATCPKRCFLGIRPGVTRFDQALAALESNNWIGEIDSGYAPDGWTIVFDWSTQQPAHINVEAVGTIQVDDQTIVKAISVPLNVTLAEVWLGYGPAVWGYADFGNLQDTYAIGYPQEPILFQFYVPPGQTRQRLLRQRATLYLIREAPPPTDHQPTLRVFGAGR